MLKYFKKKKLLISFLVVFLCTVIFLSSFSINKINAYKEEVSLEKKIKSNKEYYAIIEIDKINLKKELYDINNSKNNVNKNILVHKNSIFPDNIILASHSGNSKNAYFKNLYKLKKDDKVKIYYQDKIYEYIIESIEEQNKTGKLYLKEDANERLILITCHKNNKSQIIYYSKLKRIRDI